jgi:hypothetical protein
MNRFRRSKKEGGSSHEGSLQQMADHSENSAGDASLDLPSGSLNGASAATHESSLQAMDALVDSDPESTEIFDDSGLADVWNADAPVLLGGGPLSSTPTGTATGDGAPPAAADYQDVVRNLASPLLGPPPSSAAPRGGDASGHRRSRHGRGNAPPDDDADTRSDGSDGRDTADDSLEKSDDGSGEDYSDDEDEGEEGYRPGGYHRVSIGEVYNQRYVRACAREKTTREAAQRFVPCRSFLAVRS